MSHIERRYEFETLPLEEDLEKFAIPYTPEEFTEEEQRYLSPFFTNLDKPAFVVTNLPAEVKGALASRYSRSTKSLRRVFLDEYLTPILHPEDQKGWDDIPDDEQVDAGKTRDVLNNWIQFMEKNGGLDEVVNIQRGRAFFDKWLAEFGDDSIAELGGELLCVEGLSMVATKEMQDKRIGISPLEKSTRYVQFSEKRADGEYQYIVPGELRGTEHEEEYQALMDDLFQTYSEIEEPYNDYIQELYPKGDDEPPGAFRRSRGAKRYDDIRDLLPFSTQTNAAFYGNGRAFEDMLTRLMAHPLGEMRWWGQSIHNELEATVPSLVKRTATQRGAEAQQYRTNLMGVREEIADEVLTDEDETESSRWVNLVRHTQDPEVAVLSSFLFSSDEEFTLAEIEDRVKALPEEKVAEFYERIFEERKFGEGEPRRESHRFRKVPRAFENAEFVFDMWGRGGDYRDLHRHRQVTQERQRFTTKWGYDLEKEVTDSPHAEKVIGVLDRAKQLHQDIAENVSPDVAQYAVPFAYLQHWYMNLTAREIYWMIELRTGPQGRTHYREICQDIARQATDTAPHLFAGLMTDWGDYSLSRRESEIKKEAKLESLEKGTKE